MIIKFYFLWTFWEWFRIKAHHSASGTRALMAKLAIQTLTDEYLNNTPISPINPREMLHQQSSSRGDIYFQLKRLGVLKMSQTTTLSKTVSRIAGLRCSYFFSILHLWTPSCLFITDQWALGLSALGVMHCFDQNEDKSIGLKIVFFLSVKMQKILELLNI